MKDFKFRAWHKPARQMISWKDLCKIISGQDFWISEKTKADRFVVRGPIELLQTHVYKLSNLNLFTNPDLIFMLSPGIYDDTRQEVYEEDITTSLDGTATLVQFRRESKSLTFFPAPTKIHGNVTNTGNFYGLTSPFRIIGNSFEDPEFIEKYEL